MDDLLSSFSSFFEDIIPMIQEIGIGILIILGLIFAVFILALLAMAARNR
jgi:hypothetical protein